MRFARLSLCLSALFVAILTQAARPTPKPQEVFAPFWTSEPGWTTELQLKNNLASGSLTVTPVLRLASGKEIPLDPVTIASNDSASVWVNEGLLKHAPELLYLPTSYGSVVFRFTSLNARNLYAESVLSLRSGPIEFHVNAYPPADFAEWPRAAGPGSQEGVWWLQHSGDSDVLVVSNSGDKPLAAKLWLSDASGKRWSQSLNLAPRQTQRLDVRELVSASGLSGNYGGIKIEASAYSGALHSIHFTYNEAARTSAYLKMFERDPNATLQERIAPGESRPWTMWAPMLALQNPDPALGLPKGTALQPTIFVRNTTAKPLPASITLSWRGDSGKGKVKLEDLQLAPYETRQIQVAAMQKQLNIPDDAHWALVMLSSASAMPDDLIAIATSYDSTGRYGTESAFSGSLGAHFESGAWQVDANHNQIVTVTNGGSKPTNALLTVHYDSGARKYEIQQTIQPGDQMWVNFADLIHNRVPDRKGSVLPADASSGTYELEDANGGYGLLQDSFALNGIWGNQAQQPPLPECCGYTGVGFDPNEVDFGVLGNNDPLIVAATDQCSGGNSNISSFFTDWWSGNPAVAQVSREQVTSVGFGSTDANASGLVGYCMGDTEYWQEQYPVDPVTVFSITQTPETLNMSSGDTNQSISVTISGGTGDLVFSTGLTSNPNSGSVASVSVAGESNATGTAPHAITVSGTGSPSGIFGSTACVSGVCAQQGTTINIPPQVLIQVLYGEAHGQAVSGDSVSEPAIGSSMKNRFGNSLFPGGSTATYQAVIISSQYAGINTSITTGVSPELGVAVNLFDGTQTDTVAGSPCFFSPDAAGWTAIQAALKSGTTTVPNVNFDPKCYAKFNPGEQMVYKSSIGLNVNGDGAPAFIFERQKSSNSDPAVVEIN
jgi:hypothetical protein